MATDYALPIRRAILPALKASGAVTSLIPAERVYPVTVPAKPTFPFIRYGVSTSSPFRASCLDSSAITVAIHAFTHDLLDPDGRAVASAEDQAHRMADVIGSTLDGRTLLLEDGLHRARVTWTGSNVLVDGDEPGAWHAVVNLQVEVSG